MIGAKQGDQRVRVLLEQLGFPIDVNNAGHFFVTIEFNDGRSQGVVIASTTYKVDLIELRDVQAVAFESEGALHADVANALLVHNDAIPIGGWLLHRDEDTDHCTAIFRISIAADTTASSLRIAIEEAAKAADMVEERFTGADEF
jgi:hypothetical protein